VSPEELTAQAAWLRRLAASLAGHDTDDLVQETYVAALRRPPTGELRPWLARVLRNAVRLRHRGDTRRAAREQTMTGGETVGADVLLERLELGRLLAGLVARLDEPFRQTVLLRYAEGLSASEIARLQGIPAGTVRWRLSTALARLRTALDAETGDGKRSLSVLLLPILGVIDMKRRIAVGLGLLALLLGGGGIYLATRKPPAAPAVIAVPGSAPARPVTSAAPVPVENPVRVPEPAPIPLTAATVVRDDSAGQGLILGRVINWSTSLPVAGAQVTFSFPGGTTDVTSEADGGFRFAPPRPGSYTVVEASARGYLPFAPEWGYSPISVTARPGLRVENLTVYLSPALDYQGLVIGPDGAPVGGAEVRILGSPPEQGQQAPQDRFFTDGSGKFVFHAPDGALLEARKPGLAPGRARVDDKVTGSHLLLIRLPDAAAPDLGALRLAGIVRAPDGTAIDDALVQVAVTGGEPAENHAEPQALTDEQGRFVLEGLDPEQYTVVATAAGYGPGIATDVAPGRTDLVLELRAEAKISGRVLRASDGTAVPSFTVIVRRPVGLRREPVESRSVIDAEGRFTASGLTPGSYSVVVAAAGYALSGELLVDAPGGQLLEIRLASGGRVTGKITTAGGAPLPLARISETTAVSGASAVPISASTISAEDGSFELGGLSPGPRSLTVGAYRHHIRMLTGLRIEEGKTLGPLTVQLTPTKEGEEPRMEMAGIGAALSAESDFLLVKDVIAGGGAAEAGIQKGDAILAVDGTSVVKLGFQEALEAIRGPEGSQVRLSIRRAETVSDMVVTRRKIQM
jgi:RNA polymerase sigma factor (sigma-70 family)